MKRKENKNKEETETKKAGKKNKLRNQTNTELR